ncbi:MAG: 16S rRNA processing protein RimM [Magnetococcales bacterium]|nr:16S rRNA processing protein RimM [Magnetococcales bacterium]
MPDPALPSPSAWVAVGRITGAFGVRGEVRVESLTEERQVLAGRSEWWLGLRPPVPAVTSEGQVNGGGALGASDGVPPGSPPPADAPASLPVEAPAEICAAPSGGDLPSSAGPAGRGAWRKIRLLGTRWQAGQVIARLEGISQREEANALKGNRVWVPRDELPPPEEDQYYWSDLIGCAVVDASGAPLGRVRSMMATGANDVLIVQGPEGERLFPFTKEVVPVVDIAGKRLQVTPLPGM